MMNGVRVLMVGPAREVRGGVSTVVNGFYEAGLDRGVQLEYIPSMRDGGKLKKLMVAALGYGKFCLRVKKCDVAHVHMAAYASAARKSLFIRRARRAGKKIVIHQHGGNFEKYFLEECGKKQRARLREVFAMADSVILLSPKDAAFFSEHVCDAKKISVLYNGVQPPEFTRTDYSDHRVLYLGRIERSKGVYELIRAAKRVTEVFPDASFEFAGEGEIEECRALAEELGCEKNVHFHGWIRGDEKRALMEGCGIFALPSHFEGMPMSLLEAMSWGMASVSTGVGGVPQIIEDGENGVLTEIGDVDGLAERLIGLMQDPARKAQLGQAGCDTVRQRFNVQENVRWLEELYGQLARR